MTTPRWVVAMGGGGFSSEPDNPLLDDALLDLARRTRGTDRPRVCFIATASGDPEGYIAGFHAAFDRKADTSHLALFQRTVVDIDLFLRDQDIVYVGGGNTVNMLAIWRIHGVDRALRAAWESGVVMAGLSAGSLCWFEGGTTDSFGPDLAPLDDGLGFVAGSHCPHYDGEPGRRPLYQRLVAERRLPAGYAADDGTALAFRDGTACGGLVAADGAGLSRRTRPEWHGHRNSTRDALPGLGVRSGGRHQPAGTSVVEMTRPLAAARGGA